MRANVKAIMAAGSLPVVIVVGVAAFQSNGSQAQFVNEPVAIQMAPQANSDGHAGAKPARPSIPPGQQPEKSGRKPSNFPRNSRGQTYGSMVKSDELGETPDLVEALATNGKVGYVRLDELEAPSSESRQARYLPVYESDGVTVIGQYVSGGQG